MPYTPNYVSSQNVSVFPSAFRRSDDSHKDSYLLTERNLGNLNSSSLDYDSYVEDAGDTVVIVLGGYRFVVVKNALPATRPLFANIKINNTGNLSSFNDDTTLDVGGNFVGLYFGSDADEDATYSIEVLDGDGLIPEESLLKMNTSSITSDGEHSIATELKTDKISSFTENGSIVFDSNMFSGSGSAIYANLNGNAKTADKVNHSLTLTINSASSSFDGHESISKTIFAPTSAGSSNNQLCVYNSLFNNRFATWSTQTLGSTTKSIYVDGGVLKEGSTYAGGTRVYFNGTNKGADDIYVYAPTLPATASGSGTGKYVIWPSSGLEPTWSSATLGSSNQPIYQDSGVLKTCSNFAGGTAVTLNGTPKGADVAVFYAPTTAGTNGRLLKSGNGNQGGNQPVWASYCSIVEDDGHGVEYLSLTDGTNDGVMKIGWEQSHPIIEVDDNSTIEFNTQIQASSFNATSDSRLKDNIEEYEPSKSILDLGIKQFDLKSDGTHHIGCIAQDLREICPEIVHEDSDGYLSIEESKIVYLLLDEVRKLKSEVENLKKGR